jgi:flagellar basal body rod protein FlgC
MADTKEKLDELRKAAEGKAKTEASLGTTKEDTAELQKKAQDAMKKPSRPKYDPNNPASYKSGGYVRAADGCVQRGKTRGKMV